MSNGAYGQLGAAMKTMGEKSSTIGNVLGNVDETFSDLADLTIKDVYAVRNKIHADEQGEWFDYPLKFVGAVVGGIATGGSPECIGAGWASGGVAADFLGGKPDREGVTVEGQAAWKEYMEGPGSTESQIWGNVQEGYTVYSGMDMYSDWQAGNFLKSDATTGKTASKGTTNVANKSVVKSGVKTGVSGTNTVQAVASKTSAQLDPDIMTAMTKMLEDSPMSKEYLAELGIDIYASDTGIGAKASQFWGALSPWSDAEFRPIEDIRGDFISNQRAQMEKLRQIMGSN